VFEVHVNPIGLLVEVVGEAEEVLQGNFVVGHQVEAGVCGHFFR
jgi:hypothetical protein